MSNLMALRQDSIGLYLHIPFCDRRCRFCAFFTRDRRDDRIATFVDDLMMEITLAGAAGLTRGRQVNTLYFGGGTPTTLAAGQLLTILEACRRNFSVAADAEICIEANPAGMAVSALRALKAGGLTRVSFGAQSFDEAELEAAGVPHRVESIGHAVRAAREAGVVSVNLDLIYGFPGQSPARWRENLNAAIALEPDHISFYGLTIEEGTAFHRDVACGRLAAPDDDAMADLYQIGCEWVHAAGYRQYEVSNFARPGHECRHNQGYWTDREWLGLGPSAHSYLDGDRFSNVASLEAYHRMVAQGVPPIAERERGTPEARAREAVVFGLRTVEGVRLDVLERRYGLDPIIGLEDALARLACDGWISRNDHVLRPSGAGLMVADELAVALL